MATGKLIIASNNEGRLISFSTWRELYNLLKRYNKSTNIPRVFTELQAYEEVNNILKNMDYDFVYPLPKPFK